MQTHRIAAARIGVALRVGMKEVQHAALADHRVVIDRLLQPFPQLHRLLVEGRVAWQQVIGADDRRVAPDIAGADERAFQYGDVADPVFFREVERGCEPMPPAAHDDDVIGRLRRRVAPLGTPIALAAKGLPEH